MKNIYLYGASDDCQECETDFDRDYESYKGIRINDITAEYCFDGDWGIMLHGDIPDTWLVKAIVGNCCSQFRYKKNAGQFIHIQIPDNEPVTILELSEEE